MTKVTLKPENRYASSFEDIASRKRTYETVPKGTTIYRVTTNAYQKPGQPVGIYFAHYSNNSRYKFSSPSQTFCYTAGSPLNAIFEAILRESVYQTQLKGNEKTRSLYYMTPSDFTFIEQGKTIDFVG